MEQLINLSTDKVGEADFEQPVQVEPGQSVRSVLDRLQSEQSGSALICEAGKLVGIFTERDALKLIASQSDLDQPVENVMIPKPVTLGSDDTLGDAIRLMASRGYRRLPVIDDEQQPLGLLSTSGILQYLVDHFPSVVYTLPPTPHHSTQEREGA